MKVYNNHTELVKDIINAGNSDVCFLCNLNIYVVSTYNSNDGVEFNWHRDKLNKVTVHNNKTIITVGNALINNYEVVLLSCGFVSVNYTGLNLCYCFTKNQLVNILLTFEKEEIKKQVLKINRKYIDYIENIINYDLYKEDKL